MSEIRRVALIPFGADKGDDKKQQAPTKSVRIAIALPESNEGTCPVYNYKEELAAAKKKDKLKHINNGKQSNGLDPFDEDDDDVRRIAQEMEAKYGMGPPASKKKRKGRKDDYADIGMGYDESDSFIDNTDGYDEMIPQNVTTLHGGFYINCGALEFKTDEEVSSEISSSSSSSSSDDEEDDAPEKTSRKRILETSESEGDLETDMCAPLEKKQKVHTNGDAVLKKKKQLVVPDKFKSLKHKHHSDDAKKKKELLKEKKEETNVASSLQVPQINDMHVDDSEFKNDENAMKENKNPVSLDNMVDIIECVAKGSENNNKVIMDLDDKVLGKENVKKDVPVTVNSSLDQLSVELAVSSEGDTSRDSNSDQKTPEIVQLPENLPEDIVVTVNKIKETAAKNSEKVFTQPVNTLLLSLEHRCKCLGRQSRNKIYQYLAPYMKCRKDVLNRRVKNLLNQEETSKLSKLVMELKSKVDSVMPPLLESYDRESQKILQKREAAIENTEEGKQSRLPKRRFIWNDEIKRLLKEIILVRKRCYIRQGKTKEPLEIEMNLYIKSEIQPIWPDGWMSMATLLKMCNSFSEKKPALHKNNVGITTKPIKAPLSLDTLLNQKPLNTKPPKEKTKTVKVADIQVTGVGAKEMQKLANNAMLSITPVLTSPVERTSSPKNDITINKIDNDISSLPIELGKTSGISITPTKNIETTIEPVKTSTETIIKPVKANPPIMKTEGLIKAVPVETLMKEKPTQIINLTHKAAENPKRPPTDHKIENIIKTSSKPENLSKKIEAAKMKPENLTKPKENAVKSKPDHVSRHKSENTSKPKSDHKIKLDNLTKPENLSRSKPENLSKPQKVESRPKPENLSKPKVIDKKPPSPDDVIILDDSSYEGMESKEKVGDGRVINLSSATATAATAQTELKRKPGPKSKNKYYDPAMIKPVKSASNVEKHKAILTGNTSLDNILQENMTETENYYSNIKKSKDNQSRPPSIPNNLLQNKHTDGDDIQKVMEDLKVLQKLYTPMKTDSMTSSPVSVIAFNKSYTPKTSPMGATNMTATVKSEPKADFASGFQEAFQRQFLSDFRNVAHTTPTSSKNYNSSGHSSAGTSHQEKLYMNSNNNYTQQNTSKYKNNFPQAQPGTFNLMDDMLANFITEYAYPKAATHKPKQPPQK